jgi:hypothetical protein
MPNSSDIQWFKGNFHEEIEASLAGTPFNLDMIVAIACQETGHVWSVLRKKNFTREQILALCVGDTLDADKGRKAFPKTKADLIAMPNGQKMFDIARKALVDMAKHIPGFKEVAKNQDKFCHGFGLFQLDLQFFKDDPDYFLENRYEIFEETLKKCLGELRGALKHKNLKFENKTALTDREFAHVAIVYNTGGFNPSKDLKQGHKVGNRFYGEEIFDFIRLSRTVAKPGGTAAIAPPPTGNAIIPPPSPIEATGKTLLVDTRESPLRLRSEPKISTPTNKNVIAHLPDGHPTRAVTGEAVKGFLEIETSLFGAHLRGFASAEHLVPTEETIPIPIGIPAESPPTSGIIAVFMPRKQGTVTKRTAIAGAHSLNEDGQPSRTGTTPAELVDELAKIIHFLAVDETTHKRYQPRDGLTFCNIYTHDYCHLAGVYLPRVWWTEGAIRDLSQGKTVQPLIGNTIREMRANDLFRWLRDFGPSFGWRQTGTLSKLQEAANQGALGLIVARRKEDGKSGHIVMVVPEIDGKTAKRDKTTGEVINPLQSQAGAVNFRVKTGKLDWWKGDQFAESAFWIHS